MKKTFLSLMLAVVCCLSVNAQSNSSENLRTFGLVYQNNFKGGNGMYGIGTSFINPNFIGMDFRVLLSFNSGNASCTADLGPNYSFEIFNKDDIRVFITASLGPSGCYYSYDDVNDEGKKTTKKKFTFDAYGDAGLKLNYKKIVISAGYIYRVPEFKFNNGAGGLNVAISYCL